MSKVRLLAFVLRLELVGDDGQTLTPIETPTVRYPAAAWPPDLGSIIADTQAQLDSTAATRQDPPQASGGPGTGT